MNGSSPSLALGIVDVGLAESLMSLAPCLEEHLLTNELINLVIDNGDRDPYQGNGRITVERTSPDGWLVEIVPGFKVQRAGGVMEFFDGLSPLEQTVGRRLVGPHLNVRESSTATLVSLLLKATQALIFHHELFEKVRLTLVEDLVTLPEEFAKSIRRIVRSSNGGFALGKKKLRDGLTKDSLNWMGENLPNLESVFPGIIVSHRLATKKFAVMATRDARGLPRSVFYIENRGKKFDEFAVYRWNGKDFVPTDRGLFETFVPRNYEPKRGCGPDFVTDTELLHFFPEVASRIGIANKRRSDGDIDD